MDRAAYPTVHQSWCTKSTEGRFNSRKLRPPSFPDLILTQSTRRAAHIYFSHLSLRYPHAPLSVYVIVQDLNVPLTV